MANDSVKELNLSKFENTTSGDSTIYTLETDNDFGAVYTILESNDNFEEVDDNYLLNASVANLVYVYNNDYRIELKENFDSDTYSVTITEIQ